jgi:DeoR family transcriptional regulator of aga operon
VAQAEAEIRRERIAAALLEDGFLPVTTASARFGVSEVTIRADLAALEQRGRLRRVHGGAMPPPASGREAPLEAAAGQGAAVKRAMARRVLSLLPSGASLFLDVGSTVLAVAHALVDRPDLGERVVVTNGLTTALALEPAVPRLSVIVTGGTLRPLQHSLVNPLAAQTLAGLHVDVAIIGCNGIDADGRVTNLNLAEAEIKREVLAKAGTRILVADGSKVGARHLGLIGQLAEFDAVVTDAAGGRALKAAAVVAAVRLEVVAG